MELAEHLHPQTRAPARNSPRHPSCHKIQDRRTRGRPAHTGLQTRPVCADYLKARTYRPEDRKSVVEGKSASVRVDIGGRRIIKKKNDIRVHNKQNINTRK